MTDDQAAWPQPLPQHQPANTHTEDTGDTARGNMVKMVISGLKVRMVISGGKVKNAACGILSSVYRGTRHACDIGDTE